MIKRNLLLFGSVFVLIILGWFSYEKVPVDAYEGMTIIPEQQKDIPLFEGLKPSRSQYVIEGDRWEDIFNFYKTELPKLGWEAQNVESALDDDDYENDWAGFHSLWRKEGFDGELRIAASYEQHDNKTKVIFDKHPIYTTTTWVEDLPNSICIYATSEEENCSEINDSSKIKEVQSFINNAIDWAEGELPPRKKASVIDFGSLEIKIYYESEEEIYLLSEKGWKIMKPDPRFFELTNLSQ